MALGADAVARGGAAAWEMTLDVDCVHDKVRVGPTFGFADRRASGQGAALAPGDPEWRTPRTGTQLDSVWRASCQPRFARPLAALGASQPRQSLPASTPPPAKQPPVRLARTDPPPSPAAPQPPPARLAPAHAVAAPVALEDATLKPAAKPPVQLAKVDPVSTPTAPPRPTKADAKASVARDAVAHAPTKQAAASRAAVQVVSSPDEAEARARLARISARFGDAMTALDARVAPATVRGHAVYRGMVSGFASRADAAAFCGTLKSAGQSCLLRPLG